MASKNLNKLQFFQVDAFKRDREYRQAELKRQREEHERLQEEQAVKEELKARQRGREAAAAAATQSPAPPDHLEHVPDSQASLQTQTSVTEPSPAPITTSPPGGPKRVKKKIVLEVLSVVQNEGNDQPVSLWGI